MSEEPEEYEPIPVYNGKPIARRWIDEFKELEVQVEMERELRRKEKEKTEVKLSGITKIRAKVASSEIEKKYAKGRFSKSSEEYRERKEKDPKYESSYERLLKSRMSVSDFEIIKKIGKGAVGDVYLVRYEGKIYAMKVLSKEKNMGRTALRVRLERDAMISLKNCEWIVKLKFTFQDEDHLYFVMDYCPGGDLRGLIISHDLLTQYQVAFYIAEIILMIEEIHSSGLCHRDLKPQNILVDSDGHLKLTDFGLCRPFVDLANVPDLLAQRDLYDVKGVKSGGIREKVEVKRRRFREKFKRGRLFYSVVGTPFYIPYEVLEKRGYQKSCDWWSVGIILFELLFGYPPFFGDSAAEVSLKIRTWRSSFRVGDIIPPEDEIRCYGYDFQCVDLLKRLICGTRSRPNERGGTPLEELKKHPFFNTPDYKIDWENIRTMKVPFPPTLDSEIDSKYFDPYPKKSKKDMLLESKEERIGLTRKKYKDDSEALFADMTSRNDD